jgi:asparagine synthase (glutamine-hydrolysing)
MLDQRIIEFMAKLPGDYKVRKLHLKFLLKRVAMRILPASIINRPKAGFTIPIAHWLRSELRDMMMDTLSREKIAAHGLFDHSRIAKMVDSHVTGVQDCSRPLWTLMMFHLWYDRYVLRRSQGGASPDSESLLRPIERVEAGSSFNQ